MCVTNLQNSVQFNSIIDHCTLYFESIMKEYDSE
jgi:hypothetical protein